MTDDKTFLPTEQVTRVNLAITKTADGIAAGVVLHHDYKPHCIMSLWLPTLHGDSIRQAIRYICAKVLWYVDSDTKLVVYRSFNPQFQKYRELQENVGIIAKQYGIDVRFIYDKSRLKMRDAMFLANDAIERRTSIIDNNLN